MHEVTGLWLHLKQPWRLHYDASPTRRYSGRFVMIDTASTSCEDFPSA
jgi:hypothetical protein